MKCFSSSDEKTMCYNTRSFIVKRVIMIGADYVSQDDKKLDNIFKSLYLQSASSTLSSSSTW